MSDKLVVTVTQLNRHVAALIKGDESLAGVCVKGEISNLTLHKKTGHIFFSLKDENSALKAVMFKSDADRLEFEPEEGMSVLATGSVQCFERDGVYQLYARKMALFGEGEQAEAYKRLKEKLLKEGIFSRKRPLPKFPRKICLITAETGAALQDMLNILGRRDPFVKVTLIPALVQGAGAPDSICRALELANQTDADLIIFGRGGGSAEDLSAFDTEKVARAVYAVRIPTISAVGHETDVTLADFAADMRAPTPSAAAELAVPDRAEIAAAADSALHNIREKLTALFREKERGAAQVISAVQAKSPRQRLASEEKLLLAKQSEIRAKIDRIIKDKEHAFAERAAVISALDPLAVLTRGYSIVYKDGRTVTDASALAKGDKVALKLASGEAFAEITEVKK